MYKFPYELSLEIDFVFYLYHREACAYIRDPVNLVDIAGLVSLLAIVPLRYEKSNSQWYLATISYICNCLRLFKYFPANEWVFFEIYSVSCSFSDKINEIAWLCLKEFIW